MGKRRATTRRGAHRSEPEEAGALRRFRGFLGSTVPKRVEPPRLLNVLVVSGVILGLLLFGYSTTQIYLQFGGDPGVPENPGAVEDLDPDPSPDRGSAGQEGSGSTDGPETQAGTEPTTVAYRVVDRTDAGFTGHVTLTNTSESHLDAWELALAFDRAEVTEVHDADWEPLDDGVLARQPGGEDGLDPGDSVTVSFDAIGDPEDPPARCSLNGHVCDL